MAQSPIAKEKLSNSTIAKEKLSNSTIAAVFLDRDGTIIEDTHYPNDPKAVVPIPGAFEGLRELAGKGYLLFVVSNQSGVGRGVILDHQFQAVHARVCELLKENGVEIAEFSYCFHKPEDDCQCRKPRTGLIPKDFQGRSFDLAHSYVVGDRDIDLELGENIGAHSALVLSGKGQKTFDALSLTGSLEHPAFASLADFAKTVPSR